MTQRRREFPVLVVPVKVGMSDKVGSKNYRWLMPATSKQGAQVDAFLRSHVCFCFCLSVGRDKKKEDERGECNYRPKNKSEWKEVGKSVGAGVGGSVGREKE